jgi:hypothetical protein
MKINEKKSPELNLARQTTTEIEKTRSPFGQLRMLDPFNELALSVRFSQEGVLTFGRLP